MEHSPSAKCAQVQLPGVLKRRLHISVESAGLEVPAKTLISFPWEIIIIIPLCLNSSADRYGIIVQNDYTKHLRKSEVLFGLLVCHLKDIHPEFCAKDAQGEYALRAEKYHAGNKMIVFYLIDRAGPTCYVDFCAIRYYNA